MKDCFKNLKNNIDFFLRKKITFSRKNYRLSNEEKPALREREKYLIEKYKVEQFRCNSSLQNYSENLHTLDLLDKYLEPSFENKLKVLDVGSKNWFYAQAENLFFKKYCQELILKGIELDCNRLDTHFYSRFEIAKYHIKNLENAELICGDFLEHNEKYDYIIWILPFVFESPHLKWGLPLKHFKPKEMLKHAVSLLNEEGQIFILNQGKEEFAEQIKLCKELHLEFSSVGMVQSEFFNYSHERYLTIIKNKSRKSF